MKESTKRTRIRFSYLFRFVLSFIPLFGAAFSFLIWPRIINMDKRVLCCVYFKLIREM